jgi:hypothetical protein
LLGIIDKPASTFKAVLAQRKWWLWAVPLLILIITFAVLTVVNLPYAQELAREQAEQRLASLPAEQAEMARTTMETSLSYPVMLATSLGFGSLALLVGIVAQATFLYFGALLAGGDDIDFGAVFTMSVWTRLPAAVGFLAMAGYVALTRQMIRYPGLTALVATGNLMEDAQNPLFAILGRIDLFWLWHLVLVGVGLSVVARFGRGKSAVLALIYAALALGLTALPTFLAQLMMGSG